MRILSREPPPDTKVSCCEDDQIGRIFYLLILEVLALPRVLVVRLILVFFIEISVIGVTTSNRDLP